MPVGEAVDVCYCYRNSERLILATCGLPPALEIHMGGLYFVIDVLIGLSHVWTNLRVSIAYSHHQEVARYFRSASNAYAP
jgi:hypothetical protein